MSGEFLDRISSTEASTSPIGTRIRRVRLMVTNRIKHALAKIHTNNPSLERYLSMRIRTGNTCSYTADPEVETHRAKSLDFSLLSEFSAAIILIRNHRAASA